MVLKSVKRNNKIFAIIAVTILSAISLTGCTTSNRTYVNTKNSNSTILLYKGSSPSSGTGKAVKVYESVLCDYDLSGTFSYTSSSIKMTSGIYKNQTFTDSVSVNYNATSITVMGHTYKYKK